MYTSRFILMDSKNLFKAKLLFKLARRRKWGGSHTAFDDLKKGFKPRDHLAVKKAAQELIREGLLFRKPSSYGLHVSLNHERAKEIKQTIREFLGLKIE